ncbi:putative lipase b precursor [Phaeomoniella chlamydospora]|uniref:Putative lipase b n=1 Tax=Phaeomoniella chlamydospora TaxID=158046 RepID=A0A0G2E564_PHACM|nr:putative lipase b precursor [Phaeomoniella chlamydospora]
MLFSVPALLLGLLTNICVAAPRPSRVSRAVPRAIPRVAPRAAPLAARDASSLISFLESLLGNANNSLITLLEDILPSSGEIDSLDLLKQIANEAEVAITEPTAAESAYAAILQNVVPTATPTSVEDVLSIAASALPTSSTSYTNVSVLIQDIGKYILNSLAPEDLTANTSEDTLDDINSYSNDNPDPPTDVYPKSSGDAPYSVDEDTLRSAIYIPSTFQYGANGTYPIIMIPGTSAYGGMTYQYNFAVLFAQTTWADPVYLNVPGALDGDAQVNSEYVAYAINYISSISSGVNVTAIAWSQGNLDTQWALKYWPSTRSVVSDLISISPDFHGTEEAYIVCPNIDIWPCDPAVLQQRYSSNFVTALRSYSSGDSAYVPTTTLYSTYDEIVQPQSGTSASAYLLDARSVGVTNNQVQLICPDLPAGGLYTHEAMLYNPLSYALAVDAIMHDGPGETNRLDLTTLCEEFVPQGLGLDDVLGTEGVLITALINTLIYEPKSLHEPSLMSYAA